MIFASFCGLKWKPRIPLVLGNITPKEYRGINLYNDGMVKVVSPDRRHSVGIGKHGHRYRI